MAQPDFSDCTVLLVEDNLINRQLGVAMLQTMGVGRIEVAHDGLEGLEMAVSLRPDLIVLDVMMPRMDGFKFLAAFRSDPGNMETPIIVATALTDPDERARAFDAGASDYVTKPIDRREFAARVSVHLRTRIQLAGLQRYQERLSRDLAAARSMQEALAPGRERIAEIERAYGVRLDSVFHSSDELGGDLWGVMPIDAARFAVYVADFTGHGVAAAINTFRLHVFMAKRERLLGDPTALLSSLNLSLMNVLQRGQFATMAHAVFDIERGQVSVSCAGAPAPARLAPHGAVEAFAQHTHPLGMIASAVYETVAIGFEPGSALALYSDGLTEAGNSHGDLLGEAEAGRLIQAQSLGPAIAGLKDAGWSFEDDLTVVKVSR